MELLKIIYGTTREASRGSGGKDNLFYTLILIVLIASCDSTKFNYTYTASNQIGSKTVVVKGNLDEMEIPNGLFEFYDLNGNLIGGGDYLDGIKSGKWFHSIENGDIQITWKPFLYQDLFFSIPFDWGIDTSKSHEFQTFLTDSADRIIKRINVKKHQLNNMSFDEFNLDYFTEVSKYDFSYSIDLKSLIQPFAKSNSGVNLVQYVTNNTDYENPITAYFLLIEDKRNSQVIEITALSDLDNSESSYRILTEVALDTQFKRVPLFNRWGLEHD